MLGLGLFVSFSAFVLMCCVVVCVSVTFRGWFCSVGGVLRH